MNRFDTENRFDNGTAQAEPFDATNLGIAYNTITGLPRAAGNVALDIVRAVPRGILSIAQTLAPEKVRENIGSINPQEDFGKVGSTLLGNEPIKPIQNKAIDTSDFLQKHGLNKGVSDTIGTFFSVGGTLLDAYPGGSPEKTSIEDAAKLSADELAKFFAKTTDKKVISSVLEKLEYPGNIPDVAGRLSKAESASGVVKILEEDKQYREPVINKLSESLQQKDYEISLAEESLKNHPAKPLVKYMASRGEFAGNLPEVVGHGNSKFAQSGDEIAADLGFQDSEAARNSLNDYNQKQTELTAMKRDFQSAKADEIIKLKQSKETVPITPQEPHLKFSDEGIPLAYTAKEKSIIEASQKSSTERELLQQEIERPTTLEKFPSSVPDLTSETRLPKMASQSEGEARSLEKLAQEMESKSKSEGFGEAFSLPKMVNDLSTPVNKKINILDYFRTPENVLKKIGLGDEAKVLRKQYEGYLKELPKNIEKVTAWSKEVPKESNERIFKYLDGQAIDLRPDEKKVATEIQTWLKSWAERLGLPEDKRIANYITHIFDRELLTKEFDEDLAKIIADKVPSSVYDPFLQKRLGALGYKENTWAALDAYIKRATRKVYMDPALEKIADKASGFEISQWNYVKQYLDRINLRPTEIDNLVDNTIKSVFGYKFGQRPLTVLSQKARQMVYRGTLGLNVGSALRNLTQGVNTFADLGTKYTAQGYFDLFRKGTTELKEVGVLGDQFIQDRTLSAIKTTMQKIDKGLFIFFDMAEKINRGSAYYGAKAKALSEGKTLEQAVDFGKEVVRKTQFAFGNIDTPVALQSDLAKTIAQFQTFTVKQMEFLGDKVSKKEWAGLARYIGGSVAMLYSVGKLFGMKPSDIIPSFRFGAPPTLAVPADISKDAISGKDQYGKPLTPGKITSQIGGDIIPFIPAGVQAKKTLQGIEATSQGKDVTASGKTRYKINQTPTNYIRAGLLGKYNLPSAQNYYNKGKAKSTANRF
jgi:hypothetical protein